MKATPTVKSILDTEAARHAIMCLISVYLERSASDEVKDLLVTIPEEIAFQVLDAMLDTFVMGVLYATGERGMPKHSPRGA